MSKLEQIVRPSVSADIRPAYPYQILEAPKVPVNTPVVWGNAGDSVFELRAHAESKVEPAKWPETDRTYDVVRVFNEDDREQHIDTEVMTEYQGRNKISQDRITLRFAKPQDTKNTEVRERDKKRSSTPNDN